MRKVLIFILILLAKERCTAQFTYTSTAAQNLAGTYTDLGSSGAAVTTNFAGGAIDYDESNLAKQNIGFNFTFNGTVFTQFVINTNGYIKLGANAPVDGIYDVLNSTVTNTLAPFNQDLDAGTSTPEYRVLTTGAGGSRICTIQFKNLRFWNSSQYNNINFQIKLYETSNNIDFVYGGFTPGIETPTDNVVIAGIKGSNAANSVNVNKAATTAWASSIFINGNYTGNKFNNKNDVLPAAGRTFRFVSSGIPPLPPVINSFTPLSGPAGTSVSISGSNFNTTPANNIVFFGAVRASVVSASTFTLTVTVPSGSTYLPVSVLNNTTGLTGYSSKPFRITYNNPYGTGMNLSFYKPHIDFTTGATPRFIAVGDLDGDGKSDLLASNSGASTLSILRNTSTPGSITSTSFANKVDFATGSTPRQITIGDLDGDGKPEVMVATLGNAVSVFRNISTSGIINSSSFATRIDFTTTGSARSVACGDLDGDGKPEMVVANSNTSTVSVFRNATFSGNFTAASFDPKVDFTTGTSPFSVTISDIDGDGKLDIISANQGAGSVSVLRNISTAGSISFAAKVDFPLGSVTTPLFVAAGDLNEDAKPDLAIVDQGFSFVTILRNTSVTGSINSSTFAGVMTSACRDLPQSVAFGDLDGDGKIDLSIANYGSAAVSVLRNTSNPANINTITLASQLVFSTGDGPFSSAIADLDGDGIPEISTGNFIGNSISVLRVDPPATPTGEALIEKITTIGGTGSSTFSGDGGPAIAAGMYPYIIYVDSAENIFLSDRSNRIRKIMHTTGIITTLAGTGVAGFSGDGGPAISAKLNSPFAIYEDKAGNVYFMDLNNYRIRKIDKVTGTISTFAGTGISGYNGDGGPATSAQISAVQGICGDNAGNIYITDFNFGVIRKINTSGIISTIAGTGTVGYSGDGGQANAAQLGAPNSVSFDGAGNLYVGDDGPNSVRKINPAGIINAVAGGNNVATGSSGDGGPATSALFCDIECAVSDSSGNLYIADVCNDKIRKVNVATGIIRTIAGTGSSGYTGDGGLATAATLNRPWSISYANGSLYIADINNYVIRKVSKEYRFIGNGDWDIPGNWLNGQVPPKTILGGSIVYIDNTAGGQCDVTGNITTQQFGQLTILPTKKLNIINGDVVNAGTFNGTGTLAFSGGLLNALSSSGEIFTPLVLSNKQVYLTGETNTNSIELLNTSNIRLDNFDLNMDTSTLVGNASNYVITNSSGSLNRNVGNSPVYFPVGLSSSAYNPVTVSNSGTADTFSVRVVQGVLTRTGENALTFGSVNRSWVIEESTPGGSKLNLTMQWVTGEEQPGFDRNNANIAKKCPPPTGCVHGYEDLTGATTSGSNPYTVTRDSITTFSVSDTFIVRTNPVQFKFIGTGNFTDQANWYNGLMPTLPIQEGWEVIIDPVSGDCIYTGDLIISPKGILTIKPGKSLIVTGNLIHQ